VRRITPNGVITTFAGGGSTCTPPATTSANGTGCTPTLASLSKPRGVGSDAAGNVFIADYTSDKVFEVRASDGLMYLVAGSGTASSTGDGGPATSATVNTPRSAWGDSVGNIYIAETGGYRIRVVDTMGNIHTFAGTGTNTSSGDGAAATAATISNPQGIFVDPNLNVYVADSSGRIRVICVTCGTSSPLDNLLQTLGKTTTLNSAVNGYIYTIAGNGSAATYTGTYPILSTSVSFAPQKLSMDNSGNLYISDSNGFVWFMDFHTGYIRAIAANGTVCASKTDSLGDGCPATQASFGSNGGNGLGAGVDTQGNLYISDSTNGLIRKVITGLAFPSTAVNATTTQSVLIHALATSQAATLKQPPGPSPVTSATGEWSFIPYPLYVYGDGTSDYPMNLSFTPKVPGLRSSLFDDVSEGNMAYLDVTGVGSGAGATLDPATQTSFGTGLSVAGLATDSDGNVYVSDSNSKNVLEYSSSFGNLTQGTSAASTTLATLTAPGAVAVDPRGYVYAADTSTGLITQITPAGVVSTLPFTFTAPAGLAVDALNNLYVSDSSAQAVYQINPITGVMRNLNLGALVTPKGLTIDPSGNLLVADPGVPAIYRFNPIGTRTTVSTSAVAPSAVLTDAAGNLLIADTAAILAVPASSHSSSFTVAILAPSALAIDSAGNLYTGSGGGVLELIRTQGYAQFASSSAPSQAFKMLESGNLALSPTSLGQTDTTDYGLIATASTDCTVSAGLPTALAIGGVCALTASYTPTTVATTTDTVTVNGALNAALSTPASVQLTLTGPATMPTSGITITSISPAAPVYGQTVTVNATVTGTTLEPTGTVVFTMDSTTTSSEPVNSSGVASVSMSGLSVGVHSVTATYTSSNGYPTATTSIPSSFTVNKANPTLAWATPAAITYGTALSGTQLNAVATGVTGASLPGVFTYSPLSGVVLTGGSQTLFVSFAPTDTTDYTTPATTTVQLQVNKVASAITLVSSLNPILLQNPVTYTATVSSSAGKPTGTVTFQDGGVALTACTGVSVTTATGLASCAVTYTATGTHSITALYNGDTNFLSAGPSNTVSEAAIDIILGTLGTGSSETILPGGTATYSFPIAPSSGTTFPSPVTFTVSSSPALPSGTTMTLTPPAWVFTSNTPWSWTLPSNTALTSNTVLSVQIPQTIAAAQPVGGTGGNLASHLAPFSLAILLLPFAARLRKSGKRLGKMLAVVLLAGAGMAAIAGMSGCGSNSGFFAQPQRSYTMTVTVASGSLSHTSTITLTVE
jgi:sugar lactone lactonase YvrE